MELDVPKLYWQILQDMKGERRTQVSLDESRVQELFLQLGASLEERQWGMLQKILCVLDHTYPYQAIFEGPLCKILNRKEVPSSLKIFALAASTKHIIQRQSQLAKPLPPHYVEAVGSLLVTKDAELKEWVLRTIDEMGSEGKTLAPVMLKNRPRSWHMFNSHHRNSHGIIEELVRKWGLRAFVK